MAHFAQLNGNEVIQVITVSNAELLDDKGQESEEKGILFLQNLFGLDTVWKQTSYNSKFRKNPAMVGGTYSETLDAFIPVRPYPSWLLNEKTYQWDTPIPYPKDGKMYIWDEATTSWKVITNG